MTDTPPPEFDIAGVIRRTFESLRRDVRAFAILSALLIGAPWIAQGVAGTGIEALSGMGILITIPASCVTILGHGAMVLAALQSVDGAKVSIARIVRAATRRWLGMIWLGLVTGVLTGLAAIALLFPAFMLMTRWFVSLPILLDQGCDSSAAMSLSSARTSGRRWRIFALLISYGAATMVVKLALFGLTAWMNADVAAGSGSRLVDWALTPLFETLIAPIAAAGMVSAYVELRGGQTSGVDRVAAVFD